MRVTRIDIAALRRFERATMLPGPGFNLITGDNGAGKTSVLEALHLMAYGRSFRARVHEGLIRHGADALEVYVEWMEEDAATSAGPRTRRAGLRHAGASWTGRLDGASVDHLGELCAALAVVTVEPGSHVLIMGGAEPRRRFLDWGLFHVEPAFLPMWRRYARALKQHNAALRMRAAGAELDVWEQEMAAAGEPLTAYRQDYVRQLQPCLAGMTDAIFPGAGDSVLRFQPGWRRGELPLADALLLARDRDLQSGFTSVGPHRADWSIEQASIPGRNALSRGQAKLSALCVLLAQAEHHARLRGQWPVVALDDLASELDQSHQRLVLERLHASGAQVFLTGTEAPRALAGFGPVAAFHVEHGHLLAESALRWPLDGEGAGGPS